MFQIIPCIKKVGMHRSQKKYDGTLLTPNLGRGSVWSYFLGIEQAEEYFFKSNDDVEKCIYA
jgi:hypothetical protein